MKSLIVPGKIFLIGEYSVLREGTAILAALKPGFHYQLAEIASYSSEKIIPHPDSPLGRFQTDPLCLKYRGLGQGFGSSTAELIAGVAFQTGKIPTTQELWGWYLDHFPSASGADLATQLEALRKSGNIFKVFQKRKIEACSFAQSSVFRSLHLFQAPEDQKIKTHEDLENKNNSSLDIQKAEGFADRLVEALSSQNLKEMVVLSEWAEYLNHLGLESPYAHQVRKSLEKLPGVIAVKGCGAALNDVFAVVSETEISSSSELKSYGLKYCGTLNEHLWESA